MNDGEKTKIIMSAYEKLQDHNNDINKNNKTKL